LERKGDSAGISSYSGIVSMGTARFDGKSYHFQKRVSCVGMAGRRFGTVVAVGGCAGCRFGGKGTSQLAQDTNGGGDGRQAYEHTQTQPDADNHIHTSANIHASANSHTQSDIRAEGQPHGFIESNYLIYHRAGNRLNLDLSSRWDGVGVRTSR
jgi:hypothetical protein